MKAPLIFVFALLTFLSKAQERIIQGYVFEMNTNVPLVGVNIIAIKDTPTFIIKRKGIVGIKGSSCGNIGTTSNIDGYFSLKLNDTTCKYLTVSYLGYKDYVQKITYEDKVHIELNKIELKESIDVITYKPVIYLYPEQETKVKVELELTDGKLTTTYPVYENFWEVTAKLNGELTDNRGKKYSYLYWEGKHQFKSSHYSYDEGFIVPGDSLIPFFESVFPAMGLTYKEYNDLIVYWLPRMSENKYNFIHFRINEDYDAVAKINVTPKPDTQLRVFMEYQPIDAPFEIKKQVINKTERKGFVLVEWGGSEIQKGLQIIE
jgi:hypothetical protein